jgi:predicted N-acetyltransferase YhbS
MRYCTSNFLRREAGFARHASAAPGDILVDVPIQIRTYREGDSVEEITKLLNRAYKSLADQGLRYVASWQTPDMTAERMPLGTCLLAFDDERLVGTVMLYTPPNDTECAYYRKPGVHYFGKFAVDPDRQGEGIGRQLFDAAEAEARRQGAAELACDTAKPAAHLVAMYESWGMEIVDEADFSLTNYESWVFRKILDG